MYIIAIILLAAFVLLPVMSLRENKTLTVSRHIVHTRRLPKVFSGYCIAHVSDLHNARFGPGNADLIKALNAAQPDIIAITGDLIDSRHTNIDTALHFVRRATQIAPCYFVPGNHEARLNYTQLKGRLEKAGAIVLDGNSVFIERCGHTVRLCGIADPSFDTPYLFGDERGAARKALESLQPGTGHFTILLSHRPELFDLYHQFNIDLVLAGHAHGGQIRLPRIGGLYAPKQGLFPQYDARLYRADGTAMIVSRGLGNSLFPFRINNPPELVIVELTRND